MWKRLGAFTPALVAAQYHPGDCGYYSSLQSYCNRQGACEWCPSNGFSRCVDKGTCPAGLEASKGTCPFEVHEETCFGGDNIAKVNAESTDDCCSACQAHDGCTHFTWTPGTSKKCGLKSGTPIDKHEHTHCTSGVLSASKGTCPDYFGDVSGLVTVADPDVGTTSASAPYCAAAGVGTPCTFVHYAGVGTDCETPGPPDGCHRYYKVTYSKCDALKTINLSGAVDPDGNFDEQGIYKPCADAVVSSEYTCWGPPADAPVSCNCPSVEQIV